MFNTMPAGPFGKTVRIDLSAGTTCATEETPDFHRRYLGGAGSALHYLLRDHRAGTDALAPDNVLVFAPGLLAGTQSPAAPRYVAAARSPLTGALGKSEAGGFWGPELKLAGVGALVITGRAPRPSYLLVTPDGIEIRDARAAWGLTTGDAQDWVREDVGEPRARVALIGPGAERLVRYAGIVNDLTHFNGRNGMGAVMGSKNLKAIAVTGGGRLAVADPARIRSIARAMARLSREYPLTVLLREQGTPAGVEATNAAGGLATRNWQASTFVGADSIGGGVLNGEYLVKRGTCYACPVQCKREVAVDGERIHVDQRYGGPEYETIVAFGSNCCIDDFEVIAKANELCNIHTLDTISTGMTISFAMACFEDGLIGREETGGLDVRFGDGEVLLTLIELIARREGFGDLLAEGSVRAAARIGRGAQAHVIAVKGQEVPLHDPRLKAGLGLQFALAPNGADHWFAQHDPLFGTEASPGVAALAPLGLRLPVPATDLGPAKVAAIQKTSTLNSLYDCLGVCMFGAVARSMTPIDSWVDLVAAATGWETSLRELLMVGDRVLAMERMFNVREGIGPEADTLPERYFGPIVDGPLAGERGLDREAFKEAVRLYYRMSGWDAESGMPTEGRLVELGLASYVD